ncbi:MAG: STAS-like domain-containing protein [Polyangiaceae bacterium]
MKTITLDVGDFSLTPGGRYKAEGYFSGEEYRDSILLPALERAEKVIVNLDRPHGFTSSFLEEVFGGIVRKLGKQALERVVPESPARPMRAAQAVAFMERELKSK